MRMNRKSIVYCMLVVAAVSLATIPVTADEWPMFHHDAAHTGCSTSRAPDTNRTLWINETGGSIISSPVVAGGYVYVGSEDKKVYCYDASTGIKKWAFLTGGIIVSSPAVFGGKIYAGSYDGHMYCLDARNGSLTWKTPVDDAVTSSPVITGNTVYVGSQKWSTGSPLCNISALNVSTGAIKWRKTIGEYMYSSPAVVGTRIYSVAAGKYTHGAYTSRVYALDAATGGEIWNVTLGHYSMSSPVIDAGRLYVGSGRYVYPGYTGTLVCLNTADGREIWNFTIRLAVGGGIASSPALAYGIVYFGSLDSKVYAVDSETGDEVWNYSTGGQVASSPAVADEKVFIGSSDGTVYSIGATDGTLKWKYMTGDPLPSSPAVANDQVYLSSHAGKLYCFRDENYPPDEPDVPVGPSTGVIWRNLSFSTKAHDPDGDQLHFRFNWGDGNLSTWIGPVDSDSTVRANHSWRTARVYNITVKTKDSHGAESSWSDLKTVRITNPGEGSNITVELTARLGVKALIKNNGDDDVEDVQWRLTIQGVRKFSRIDTQKTGLADLTAGGETVARASVFGFGQVKITVNVTYGDEDPVVRTADGFILGFLVMLS